jgi:entericidin B
MMVRKVLVVAALGLSVLLAGCNTVQGIGRDIESVGKAGEKAI